MILLAVIDLARLVIGFSPGSYSKPEVRARFFEALFQGAEWQEQWSTPIPKMRETNMLLLLRALANAFQEESTIGDGAWIKFVCGVGLLRDVKWLAHCGGRFSTSSVRHPILYSQNSPELL